MNIVKKKTNYKLGIALMLIFVAIPIFSQRYSIRNGDTIRLSELSYLDKKMSRDTLWRLPCNTFEFDPINGRIINKITNKCLRKGYWFYYNHNRNLFAEGNYKKGKKHGIWNYYNDIERSQLKYEIEYYSGHELKTVQGESIDYQYDKLYIILVKNQKLLVIILLSSFILHLIFNVFLFRKKGTGFHIYSTKPQDIKSNLIISFKLFWSVDSLTKFTGRKVIVAINNTISIMILLCLFILVITAFIYPEGLIE